MVHRGVMGLLLMLSGCAASGAAVTSALVHTAIAATASGVQRANGGCYSPCNPGHRCNTETGLCDKLPCGGACSFDQRCELTATGEACRKVDVTK